MKKKSLIVTLILIALTLCSTAAYATTTTFSVTLTPNVIYTLCYGYKDTTSQMYSPALLDGTAASIMVRPYDNGGTPLAAYKKYIDAYNDLDFSAGINKQPGDRIYAKGYQSSIFNQTAQGQVNFH